MSGIAIIFPNGLTGTIHGASIFGRTDVIATGSNLSEGGWQRIYGHFASFNKKARCRMNGKRALTKKTGCDWASRL